MKVLTQVLVCVTVMLLSVGCFNTTVVMGSGSGTAPIEAEDKSYHSAVVGLVDFSGPIRLDKVCPSGVVRITQQTSFVNGLVASLTNMYTPQTFSVFCANKQAFEIHLDDRGQIASFQRLD